MSDLTMSQKIALFPVSRMRSQVGRGECFDLADRALRHAGAKSAADYGKITDDADYVWGKSVELKDVQPGDILQFRNHVIWVTTTTTSKVKLHTGQTQTTTEVKKVRHTRPHHTAIVRRVLEDGAIEVFEQKVKPLGKRVQKHTLYTRDFVRTKGEKVVEVKTEGRIWAYRPQPR